MPTSSNTEPLVVKPKRAWIMLGCGNTRGYELLAAGELDSFQDGRSRKITVESIYRYISRRLPPVVEKHAPRMDTEQRKKRVSG